ncbi:hypothetical protein B0T24DRAFT_658032 [Lasiosphaeria ovina]|uniref:Nephrocystin 3-like N-terminal domain-containing protein n=1 Tax=Lasiosphaeria ovina TaxID=92902 RepID=A0AAE0N667_9PEZI|nr:hypothetical protein B0T24DRAFT_658032 [Lasiosphaeria ovina]
MFQQLQVGLDHLRQGLHVTCVDHRVLGDFHRLIGLHEDALSAGARRRVLRTLSFEDMRQRYDAVNDPHAKTFQWILRSQDGVLHVAGKLGSGKSTIMKFLAQCPETNEGLKIWAGDRKLVFATFFFWKPGSELQRSLPGLLRSLLHDILTSCPKIIPDHDESPISIPPSVILLAFNQLVSRNTTLRDSHCFCFLIDGLDEYAETAQHDRRHMVDLLNNWRKASPGAVKLCASSREDNVFMNAFPADTRLCLHN